ncbi:superoxide dismutase [Ureibacillus massiliensis 4400831 = CIP 108448 = CCUG 49529]|uniref:Superoxide dismutase n=1 Tax=Ureibacillus massiliensis 4400831 = CIP 108448 = CCUG 49529 TaxID=1211035 RepID=A0A0A3IZR7_9BACL|nr:superoxide dismutase family protein [Ureibacillus massiliensis]KGR90206.1 superoxide dismutase [Ureibacillus massiliensis 4400831 = CIP 108448 = CCUG 49529]
MKKNLLLLGLSVLLLSGCSFFGFGQNDEATIPVSAPETSETQETPETSETLQAEAKMVNADGNELGVVNFTESNEGVMISLNLKDVPEGERGIHIHAVGKCEPPTFESAGDHFNPTEMKHGVENPEGPHAGDLPNVTPENGVVASEYLAKNLTLQKGMANSLLDEDGSAIVLHENADDYKTDPSGESGGRIGCGVITPIE